MSLFLLMFLAMPVKGQTKLTFEQALEKCKKMDKITRQKSTLCKKVVEKIKRDKIEKEKKALEEKELKIKEKCQSLGNEKMIKYKQCQQYLTLEPDPLLGEPKDVSAKYSFLLGYSLIGNINGIDFSMERKSNRLGFGLFYSQHKLSDLESTKVSGSAYGLELKYHFIPLYAQEKIKKDFSLFSQIGLTKYESETQGTLPSYFYNNTGLEYSQGLYNNISGFAKIGITHIYHSESDFLNLGTSATIGLKIDF